MLLEYGLRNFFSFKEGAIVSFRFDGNTPESISHGLPAATVMGVNGANASGKTHLLKALDFIGWFGAHSFDWKPDSSIPVASYAENEDVSEFYVEFTKAKVVYRYEIAVTDDKVHREALYRTKAKRVLLFERLENKIKSATKEVDALRTLTLRNNVSVISTVNQHQLPILQDVYKFLAGISSNVGYGGFHAPYSSSNATAKMLFKAPALLKFVETFIKSCDTGVANIRIYEREGEKGERLFFPLFTHVINGKEHDVSAYEESSGTKYLFRTLPDYAMTLASGGTLIVDEFDLHLHPHILPKLVDLFATVHSNPLNAQLIFTSHNTRIMDSLGRYRSYVVNKRENESFAFRLDEVPGDLLRNDRPVSPVYEDGKIGGIPRI